MAKTDFKPNQRVKGIIQRRTEHGDLIGVTVDEEGTVVHVLPKQGIGAVDLLKVELNTGLFALWFLDGTDIIEILPDASEEEE